MLDFTSSLYLGLRHASASLRPWAQLTTGVPAALEAPSLAGAIAARLAALTGTERATLARSTLHGFWDLFVTLSGRETAIYVDAGTYPIARWGVERAKARGTRARTFRHHDPAELRRQLTRDARSRLRPIVLADGFCPGCATPAPLGEYLASVRDLDGRLVIDDTQALGIFGASPGPGASYGRGGGGMLRWSACGGPELLLVSSLAKGLGVPLAMVGGSAADVALFERNSETRMHCSPPSFADLHAAERALSVNRTRGETRRLRLAALVSRFRRGLHELGLAATGARFPVQSLALAPGLDAALIHRGLLRLGVRTVLHQPACRARATVSFLITAHHTPSEIDRALDALPRVVRTAVSPPPQFGAASVGA